jgi:hypothetical protein
VARRPGKFLRRRKDEPSSNHFALFLQQARREKHIADSPELFQRRPTGLTSERLIKFFHYILQGDFVKWI